MVLSVNYVVEQSAIQTSFYIVFWIRLEFVLSQNILYMVIHIDMMPFSFMIAPNKPEPSFEDASVPTCIFYIVKEF